LIFSEISLIIKTTMTPLPEIYEYLDYRAYLSDFYDAKKRINPLYSYRVFARKAGFNNQGFFIDVVKRRKKLSDNAAKKMIRGMDLADDRARYFKYLVKYDQAGTGKKRSCCSRSSWSLSPRPCLTTCRCNMRTIILNGIIPW